MKSWRYSPELSREPAGWSEASYATSTEARAAGQARYEGPIYTGYVVPMGYSEQLPSARDLLAEMKERAADRGVDVSSFDSLTDADVAVLEDLLRKCVANWEAWLVSGANGAAKRSTVVLVSNVERHEPREL